MKPSRAVRDFVRGVLEEFATADPAMAERFSLGEGVTGIGSGPQEYWVGGPEVRAIVRRQFEELGPVPFKPERIDAFEEGTVGWAAICGSATLADEHPIGIRMTFVVHRADVDWEIVHGHISVEASNKETFGRELTTSLEDVADLIEKERPDLAPVASPEGTLTIMFTDMEGSTATNEALGDDRFLPILLKRNEIIQQRTRNAGGTIVKSQGDGFMLAFPSARKAVECAMCVQRDVSELSEQLRVRMGLHTGEPVRHADDFYGRDVAYAARLGSAATGGEILVSSLVKALVEPSGSVRFEGPRDLELKGFDGPQPVYAVKW